MAEIEERMKELKKEFRQSLSKISPETRKLMAVKVEKIVGEELDYIKGEKVNG